MFHYYTTCFKKYADFGGRARRMEYWSFTLFNSIFGIVAVILDNVFGVAIPEVGYGPIYGLFCLATFIPGLSVFVRRLHDTGRSGWYFLISLIPLVGPILLLVWLFTDSKPETNKWGPSPKTMDGVLVEEE